jgi:hypothetical protein
MRNSYLIRHIAIKSPTWAAIIIVTLILTILMACNVGIGPWIERRAGDLKESVSSTASLEVFFSDDGLAAYETKTLIPAIDLATAVYTVSGAGPDGATFSLENLSASSVTIHDIVLGSWEVTVVAYNAAGMALGQGSNNLSLIDGGATVYITVLPYTDPGDLNLSVSWPGALVTSPVVYATLTLLGSETTTAIFTISAGTASYSDAGLTPGYHLLIFELYDGNVHRHSIVESIRIVSNQTTSGCYTVSEYDLTADALPNSTFSVAAGEYAVPQVVAMYTAASGATIRYTLNGSPPSSNVGRIYSAPVMVSSSATLRAIATKDGYRDSQVSEANYVITDSVETPTVSPAEGLYFESILAALHTSTPGTSILYTENGSEPVPGSNGSIYSTPIPIATDTTLKAVAFYTGVFSSTTNMITANYRITDYVDDPVFSLEEGTFFSEQMLVLTTTTEGADIYFTVDGTSPSIINGMRYIEPLLIDGTLTVKAVAVKADWGNSQTVDNVYTIKVSDPTSDIPGGTYNVAQSITLSCDTSDTSIIYTTDGTSPLVTGILYSGAIDIAETTTLKYAAIRDGWTNSNVLTEMYTLQVVSPTFDPPPGIYGDSSIGVVIDTANTGANIIYTTDGSTPSTINGYFGNNPNISGSSTLRAVAVRNGWADSGITAGLYNLDDMSVIPPNGSILSAGSIDIDFPNWAEAISYHVQLSTTDDFFHIVEEDSALTTSDYVTVTSKGIGEIWFWRYRYNDGSMDSDWLGPNAVMGEVYDVGEIGPAGGIVFYDKGSYSDGWRWLEVALVDQSEGVPWGDPTILVGTSADLGTGKTNTQAITDALGMGAYAARICHDLPLDEYEDWFLPSIDELDLIIQVFHMYEIGTFNDGLYWSSTEDSISGARVRYYSNSTGIALSKWGGASVRAVRDF